MTDVTLMLQRIEQGDTAATDELLPLVYDELRKLATARLKNESDEQALEATGLVHEVYIRLVDGNQRDSWANRAHFFSAAAEAMRRILIDQARARKSQKRGGLDRTISLDTVGPITAKKADDLVRLNDALTLLESNDSQKAQLVKLKFFVGSTTEEAAKILGVSVRTAERSWAFARAWLYSQMAENDDETAEMT